MALFRLRSQQTGTTKEFTLLDILNAIGDPTNDEIRFPDGNREDVFNLSSFEELGQVNGSQVQITEGKPKLVNEALSFSQGQESVNLSYLPASICMVFLNGLKMRQGIDYNKYGKTLTFLNPLQQNANHSDLLEALYDISP